MFVSGAKLVADELAEWLNRFYLTALWALISLVVPLASFFFFVKIQQKELTVAIAFTVRSLCTDSAVDRKSVV